MKIYVAARFYEKDEVRRIYRLLLAKDHQITADWTLHENIKPYSQNPVIAGEYASEDIDGVTSSDAFILLTGEKVGGGVSSELGAAIASYEAFEHPKIYIVGPYFDNSVMYYHPAVNRRDTIEEVLSEL